MIYKSVVVDSRMSLECIREISINGVNILPKGVQQYSMEESGILFLVEANDEKAYEDLKNEIKNKGYKIIREY